MISWEATVSQGWEKLPGTTNFIQWPPVYLFLMLLFHSRNQSSSSAIPQAVPEIIWTDVTVLQTSEVDLKKNQKFQFFVTLYTRESLFLVKYLYYLLRLVIYT